MLAHAIVKFFVARFFSWILMDDPTPYSSSAQADTGVVMARGVILYRL